MKCCDDDDDDFFSLRVLATTFLALDKITEQLDKMFNTDILFGETWFLWVIKAYWEWYGVFNPYIVIDDCMYIWPRHTYSYKTIHLHNKVQLFKKVRFEFTN